MPTYLDDQVSQNSGSFGSPLTPVDGAPLLFGTLGLITSGAGPNLRVQFEATVTISAIVSVASSVIIQIVRGLGGPGVGTTVYTAIHTSARCGRFEHRSHHHCRFRLPASEPRLPDLPGFRQCDRYSFGNSRRP